MLVTVVTFRVKNFRLKYTQIWFVFQGGKLNETECSHRNHGGVKLALDVLVWYLQTKWRTMQEKQKLITERCTIQSQTSQKIFKISWFWDTWIIHVTWFGSLLTDSTGALSNLVSELKVKHCVKNCHKRFNESINCKGFQRWHRKQLSGSSMMVSEANSNQNVAFLRSKISFTEMKHSLCQASHFVTRLQHGNPPAFYPRPSGCDLCPVEWQHLRESYAFKGRIQALISESCNNNHFHNSHSLSLDMKWQIHARQPLERLSTSAERSLSFHVIIIWSELRSEFIPLPSYNVAASHQMTQHKQTATKCIPAISTWHW